MFHKIYHEVQDRYGNDVIPICIQYSFDGTDILSGGGGSTARSATPFNIRLLNLCDDQFRLKSNTQFLAGFCPSMTVS